MYNRRNSLQRSSSKRYSQGLSPAAAAAMVSFSQQNPRQNSTVLAANAAAEALRRHSLDAEGAQAVANFGRRGSMTSQSGDRRNSLQRRNSITSSQRVSSRDQYGRAMSLTTTTVRQMGSFEIVKQQTTPVRPPRAPRAPESLYSLESLREEPEHHHHQGGPQQQNSRKGPKNRVSFQADTSEFHYDSYGYEEPNALAAAAAVVPGRRQTQSLQPPPRQVRHSSASPMKSALKKPFEETHYEEPEYEQFEQYEQPQFQEHQENYEEPHYEQHEEHYEEHQPQYDNSYARYEEPEQEQTQEEEREFVTRPLSAVSEFSTVTAKEDFEDSDGSSVQRPGREDSESVSDLEEDEREFVPKGEAESSVEGTQADAAGAASSGTVHIEAPTSFEEPSAPSEAPLRNLPPPSMSTADVASVTQSPSSSPREPRAPREQPERELREPQAPKAVTLKNGANGSVAHAPQATKASAAGAAARALGQPPRRVSQQPPRQGQGPHGQQGVSSVTPPQGASQGYPRPQRQGPPPGMVQGHPQQAPHPHHAPRSQPQVQQSTYRALQQRQQQQQQQQQQQRTIQRSNSLTYRDSYSVPRQTQQGHRTLQPSPSIDGFNRISNTNDIIEQARARARAYVQEQPSATAFAAPLTLSQDDASSINSDSSWKRERAARKPGLGRFRGRSSVDSPASRVSSAGAGAPGTASAAGSGTALTGPVLAHGRRSSTASSSFGGNIGRVQSPQGGGRTYSLRGQAPPDMSRKWRSRFEDSDDEDAAQHKPQMLPKLVDTPAAKPKKKGFLKRLFSSK